MKRAILLTMAVLVGNVVLAQAPASRAPTVAAAAAARATTNNVNLRAELRDIETKLYPAEQKLMAKDPEIKAMMDKRKELQAALLDLDKKKEEKIEERLAAEPATAALAARRKELQKKIAETGLSGTSSGAGTKPAATAPRAPAVVP